MRHHLGVGISGDSGPLGLSSGFEDPAEVVVDLGIEWVDQHGRLEVTLGLLHITLAPPGFAEVQPNQHVFRVAFERLVQLLDGLFDSAQRQ